MHEKTREDDAEVGSITTAVKSEVFSLSDIDPGALGCASARDRRLNVVCSVE
jgi:hypothetical protein